MGRTFALATLVAGAMDILWAIMLTLIAHKAPADMLRGVAAGPFPHATEWGAGGAWLGLATHFVLMAIMVAVYLYAARNWPVLLASPIKWGVIYGLVTYVVMNLIVIPLRFGAWPPKPMFVATQLFSHIVLVGIPIALIAARGLSPKAAA